MQWKADSLSNSKSSRTEKHNNGLSSFSQHFFSDWADNRMLLDLDQCYHCVDFSKTAYSNSDKIEDWRITCWSSDASYSSHRIHGMVDRWNWARGNLSWRWQARDGRTFSCPVLDVLPDCGVPIFIAGLPNSGVRVSSSTSGIGSDKSISVVIVELWN